MVTHSLIAEHRALKAVVDDLENDFNASPYVWLVRAHEMPALQEELQWRKLCADAEREGIERYYARLGKDVEERKQQRIEQEKGTPIWVLILVGIVAAVLGFKCYYWMF